jgi:hypothetical protein
LVQAHAKLARLHWKLLILKTGFSGFQSSIKCKHPRWAKPHWSTISILCFLDSQLT